MQITDKVRENEGEHQKLALKVIDDEGVIFISEPQFSVDKIVEEGTSFMFTVSDSVAPIMKLASYDPVAIGMPSLSRSSTVLSGGWVGPPCAQFCCLRIRRVNVRKGD